MVTCTGHMKGRTDVRADVVRTDVHDVMAIKPNFLSMGYHIFLTMVLRARGAPLLNIQECSRQHDLLNSRMIWKV